MHPTTFLNGNRWEDEYDTPVKRTEPLSGERLNIIAEHIRRPWYEKGSYGPDVIRQCVEAGLLTVEEMEDAT